MVMQQL